METALAVRVSYLQVYALMGGFASCPVNFHALDGSGYAFIADSVIELDKLNAQVRAQEYSHVLRYYTLFL